MQELLINQATKKNIIAGVVTSIVILISIIIVIALISSGKTAVTLKTGLFLLIFLITVFLFFCFQIRGILKLKRIYADYDRGMLIIKQIFWKKTIEVPFADISEFCFSNTKDYIADSGEHDILKLEVFGLQKEIILSINPDFFPDTGKLEKRIKITWRIDRDQA